MAIGVTSEYCRKCQDDSRRVCDMCKKDLLNEIKKANRELKIFIGAAGSLAGLAVAVLDVVLRIAGH